ncbi:hypothetical protein PR048_009985 [Dryococelus australis]|uniref:HTH CENPB-type domain-containing protein n=1 Tax=Dryococelus australis TaxID=614101 RepID=A0ABQ9I1G2_9NEOP|nr:hypothetical protein PR048_009985 [Dryococelus australis]
MRGGAKEAGDQGRGVGAKGMKVLCSAPDYFRVGGRLKKEERARKHPGAAKQTSTSLPGLTAWSVFPSSIARCAYSVLCPPPHFQTPTMLDHYFVKYSRILKRQSNMDVVGRKQQQLLEKWQKRPEVIFCNVKFFVDLSPFLLPMNESETRDDAIDVLHNQFSLLQLEDLTSLVKIEDSELDKWIRISAVTSVGGKPKYDSTMNVEPWAESRISNNNSTLAFSLASTCLHSPTLSQLLSHPHSRCSGLPSAINITTSHCCFTCVPHSLWRIHRSEAAAISGPMLIGKGKKFYRKTKLTVPFTFSEDWLTRFKDMYGIRKSDVCGEQKLADVDKFAARCSRPQYEQQRSLSRIWAAWHERDAHARAAYFTSQPEYLGPSDSSKLPRCRGSRRSPATYTQQCSHCWPQHTIYGLVWHTSWHFPPDMTRFHTRFGNWTRPIFRGRFHTDFRTWPITLQFQSLGRSRDYYSKFSPVHDSR